MVNCLLNIVCKDRVVEGHHEYQGYDVTSNDQRLQAERNSEPPQGLVMVIFECRSHHEVPMEPALNLCCRIVLSYRLTRALHWEQCDSVAGCA